VFLCAPRAQKSFTEDLAMNPPDFGPHLRERIKERLRTSVEGTAMGRIGYVVYITEIQDADISMGKIEDSTGQVTYRVRFKAVVFRPFRNEVLDAVVTTAVNFGFYCKVGPLQIFVSRHMLPDDVKNFDHDRSSWISDDKEVEIRAGCGVRLRLMSVEIYQNNITAVASIKDDYLGLISAADM
jgi:DNA-directed RNA polymerase II subunit RPB7